MSDHHDEPNEPITGEHAGFIRLAKFRVAEIRQRLADIESGQRPPPPPTAELEQPRQLGLLEDPTS